ncbi:MAG TPA: excinuclease ABC subunit A, partial [Verrucomicrobiales bacterium]|nr:excinuclease ABC subunit A [Verrucomicrobiales bacterium]
MKPRSAISAFTKLSPGYSNEIVIQGAREHNLKNLNVVIPRNQLVVITGVSGSGKSTLAFDILFGEGQRRFLDSMNAYARQFVESMARPEVDRIDGIPPTVSIEQRNSRGGGKSTVATVTEIYHFIRLLFARLGTVYCPDCMVPVETQTTDRIIKSILDQLKFEKKLTLLAPVVRDRKGFHTEVGIWARKHGYDFLRADGNLTSTEDRIRLDRFKEHNLEVLIGTLEVAGQDTNSLNHSARMLIEESLQIGGGTLFTCNRRKQDKVYSTKRSCPKCQSSFEQLDPKSFSYNSSRGWCMTCRGFGELFYLPDVDRGAKADAIEESWFRWQEGEREECPDCQGARLNPIARSVRLTRGQSNVDLTRNPPRAKSKQSRSSFPPPTIEDLSSAAVNQASRFFESLQFEGKDREIASDILPEIRERLKFLNFVGLDYLQLGRSATTLSGGEAQRIRLAAQLGSTLSGVLYVLDEPTIGLHARDNERLLEALATLKQRGNSIVVVEHDEETMMRADHIIDLGPGAGIHGGEVIACGSFKEIIKNPKSLTGQFLKKRELKVVRKRRKTVKPGAKGNKHSNAWLVLKKADKNNLKNLTVSFPLNRLVLVTGVSGSGKSTLVRECLLPTLDLALKRKRGKPPTTANLTGFENLDGVYEVDQSPIGRTPRSIPATYVGFFDTIRKLFSKIPEARLRGYLPGRFSFNSKPGRCQECDGAGKIKLEMNFLPAAYIDCESCNGTRFNPETLDIEYKGMNIAQILDLSIEEAEKVFQAIPAVREPLQALKDTGLGYIKLGQISPTLSGGEAQRMKLVTHLLSGMKESGSKLHGLRKHRLFVLEEPTIGLHMADVHRLIEILQRLIDSGHSVIVIEHNMDLI